MVKYLLLFILLRPIWAADPLCNKAYQILRQTNRQLENIKIKKRRHLDMRINKLSAWDNTYKIDFGDHKALNQIAELDLTMDLVTARDGITPRARLILPNNKDQIIFLGLKDKGTAIVQINGRSYALEVDIPTLTKNESPYRSPPKERPIQRFYADFDLDGSIVYYVDLQDTLSLTAIEEKMKLNKALDKNELRFLYQINPNFPKITIKQELLVNKIISHRNKKEDLALVLGLKPSEISLTSVEALEGGIKYHYGNLDLRRHTSFKDLTLPEEIGKGLYLDGLTSAKGIKFPKKIGGNLDLRGLNSLEGVEISEQIGGSLNLSGLISLDGAIIPTSIPREKIYLPKHLKLP